MQLTRDQLDRLRPLVEAETGMDFSGERVTRLVDAVAKAVAKHHVADFDQWLASPHERGPLLEQLTAELTIGESFFFRNEHHFHALREEVIPEILRRNARRREVRVWSAGCATGEEPYSLGILLDQILGTQKPAWTVSILATDINTDFLRRARKGHFRPWSFRRTQIHLDPRYFQANGDDIRLLPHVQERVRFVFLNLVKDVYPSPLTGTVGLDLILFRNVAIYLQPEVVQAIVGRFYQCLHPGGWLLPGEAEVSHMQSQSFDVRRFGSATLFQRPSMPGSVPRPEHPRPVLPRSDCADPRPTALPAQAITPASQSAGPRPQANNTTAQQAPVSKPRQSPPERLVVVPFHWDRVEQCLLQEDFDAAERHFDVLRDRHQRSRMILKYVERLLDLSQTSRARETLDACLKMEPLMIDGHLLKASLAEERGELAEAEAACRRALYLDRNSAMAHFHLALIQQQRGDPGGARRSFQVVEKLAEIQDANALVEHGDGVCYGRLSDMARSMM